MTFGTRTTSLQSTLVKAVLALTFLLGGCGPSRESAVAGAASQEDQLRARASFDMQCPKNSLEIVPLKQQPTVFHSDVLFTTVAGVRGCAKQATYVWEGHRGVWLLNTDSSPTDKDK